MRNFYLFIIIFIPFILIAQGELNAIVTINSDKIQSSNKQVYKTLEKQLVEFINQTKWTNKKFLTEERINCAFTLIINSQKGNNFSGSIQIQATRPVYNSSYETPILNINDNNLSFEYNEFQPLIYNSNSFNNNLVSIVVFYVYTILGVDADTFEFKGGQKYFNEAQNIVLQAQNKGYLSWQNKIGKQNRFALIDGLLSSKFEILRKINYNYHIKGIDILSSDEIKAKNQIQDSLLELDKIYNITIGNYMLRVFLDAKSNEIVNIFSDGKTTGKEIKIKEVLQKIFSTQNDKWKKIKT